MSAVIRNRIKKLEAAVLPPAPKLIQLIEAPPPDAGQERLRAFEAELVALRRANDLVIVTGADERMEMEGVAYCDSAVDAQVLAAVNTPSEAGRRSLLDDVLASLSGNVIGGRGYAASAERPASATPSELPQAREALAAPATA